MEVGVGVVVEADRAEVTHGVRRRRPISDVLTLGAGRELDHIRIRARAVGVNCSNRHRVSLAVIQISQGDRAGGACGIKRLEIAVVVKFSSEAVGIVGDRLAVIIWRGKVDCRSAVAGGHTRNDRRVG